MVPLHNCNWEEFQPRESNKWSMLHQPVFGHVNVAKTLHFARLSKWKSKKTLENCRPWAEFILTKFKWPKMRFICFFKFLPCILTNTICSSVACCLISQVYGSQMWLWKWRDVHWTFSNCLLPHMEDLISSEFIHNVGRNPAPVDSWYVVYPII